MDLLELAGDSNETSCKEITSNNLTCTDFQDCKKCLAGDWELLEFNIPRKNCSTVEVEESFSRF